MIFKFSLTNNLITYWVWKPACLVEHNPDIHAGVDETHMKIGYGFYIHLLPPIGRVFTCPPSHSNNEKWLAVNKCKVSGSVKWSLVIFHCLPDYLSQHTRNHRFAIHCMKCSQISVSLRRGNSSTRHLFNLIYSKDALEQIQWALSKWISTG